MVNRLKKKWSDEEIKFLIENYTTMTCKEISKHLNRTTKSVLYQFHKLHLNNNYGKATIPNIGDTINQLTIEEIYLKNIGSQNKRFVKCKCSCGQIYECLLTKLVNNIIKDCGCIEQTRPDMLGENNRFYKHGKSFDRLMSVWSGMITRCNNKKSISYHNYGGRGIMVCDNWLEYLNFYNWAMANNYQNNLTLERINVNGNYCPENCKWIPYAEQYLNKRNSRKITAWNETKCLIEWFRDERVKIDNNATFEYRIKAGWTIERALSQPARKLSRSY